MQLLEIQYIDIDSLTPCDNNAKIHTSEQIEEIKKSIKGFGMNDPIGVWGEENLIVEGHGRLIACKELGLKEVPVIRLDGLTDEQRRAYTLAHNQLTMSTGFDLEKLKVELDEISLDMADFGFDDMQLDDSTLDEENEIVEDEIPEVPEEPKSKYGDIYQLGNHRLMCGDSTKQEDVEKLMNGAKAYMVLTDPPYGINVVKSNRIGGGGKKHFGGIGGGKIVKASSYKEIIGDDTTETAKLNYEIIKKFSQEQIIFGGNYFTDFLYPSRCWIVWDKKNTCNFADAELAWTSYDKSVKLYTFTWNGLVREGSKKVEGAKRVHPTQKPVGLIINILNDFKSGDECETILDCFGGSGSTLIACEQLNLKCYMMELDPYYVDVIIKRWENLTGKKSEKLN